MAATGYVSQVMGPIVDICFEQGELPDIYNELSVTSGNKVLTVEVIGHIGNCIARCIAAEETGFLERGAEAVDTGRQIGVPVGENTLGNVYAVGSAEAETKERWSIRRSAPPDEDLSPSAEMLECGIKAVDLLCPYLKGGRIALVGGADTGKALFMTELMNNISQKGGVSVFAGIEERLRGGLYDRIREAGILRKTALVAGRMNETPGARIRAMLSGLTMAEYFRDREKKNVLLFFDNMLRFNDAGSGIFTMLEMMASHMDYRPVLPNALEDIRKRIASTKNGSVTSIQTVLTEDENADFEYMNFDAVSVLTKGSPYQSIDPVKSVSRILLPEILGQEHCRTAREVREILIKEPSLAAAENLSEEDKRALSRARKVRNFLTQPFYGAEKVTHIPGKYVPLEETLRGFREILDGKYDKLPDSAFLYIGSAEEAAKKQ